MTVLIYLGVAQLGARYLGVVEAAGSSPVTQMYRESFGSRFFVFHEAPYFLSCSVLLCAEIFPRPRLLWCLSYIAVFFS